MRSLIFALPIVPLVRMAQALPLKQNIQKKTGGKFNKKIGNTNKRGRNSINSLTEYSNENEIIEMNC